MENRGTDSKEVIEGRMNKAMNEISHYNEYDYVIVNDDFEESLLTMRSIILANRAKTQKQTAQVKSLFNLD